LQYLFNDDVIDNYPYAAKLRKTHELGKAFASIHTDTDDSSAIEAAGTIALRDGMSTFYIGGRIQPRWLVPAMGLHRNPLIMSNL
jgi:hypothetical protein